MQIFPGDKVTPMKNYTPPAMRPFAIINEAACYKLLCYIYLWRFQEHHPFEVLNSYTGAIGIMARKAIFDIIRPH